MPQPPLDIRKYLGKPLPHINEKYSPGSGTGPRAEWPEGTLKGIEVIDNFSALVKEYIDSLPKELVRPNPYHKYTQFVQVAATLPNPFRTAQDLQHALKVLPLSAISSVLTALEGGKYLSDARAYDNAGYESDGGWEEEATIAPRDDSKAWRWGFSKSPMGAGDLLLQQGESDDVKLVVRTTNSSAFAQEDWDEYCVTGPFRYSTKSKASWWWSRQWGACKRLGTRWFVLTDWKRWAFGVFNEDQSHAWISPIVTYSDSDPTVMEALFFWAQSAKADPKGFKRVEKDVSGLPPLFPDTPARRQSVSGKKDYIPRDPRGIRVANESDIEESDVE